MPTKAFYPTMTSDHWTNEPMKVIDSILVSFFTSLKSQSNLFFNDIKSFAALMYEKQGRPEALSDEIKSNLESQFNLYFDNVQITTVVTTIDLSKSSITISGTVQDTNSEVFDISRVFNMDGSVLVSVLSSNNG